MNPIYAVMESPYRWLILAGIAFLAGGFGAMFMLAYDWPHGVARIWLWASIVCTAILLGRAGLDWVRGTIAEYEAQESNTRPRQDST